VQAGDQESSHGVFKLRFSHLPGLVRRLVLHRVHQPVLYQVMQTNVEIGGIVAKCDLQIFGRTPARFILGIHRSLKRKAIAASTPKTCRLIA